MNLDYLDQLNDSTDLTMDYIVDFIDSLRSDNSKSKEEAAILANRANALKNEIDLPDEWLLKIVIAEEESETSATVESLSLKLMKLM